VPVCRLARDVASPSPVLPTPGDTLRYPDAEWALLVLPLPPVASGRGRAGRPAHHRRDIVDEQLLDVHEGDEALILVRVSG
jgi:hypothetical protein